MPVPWRMLFFTMPLVVVAASGTSVDTSSYNEEEARTYLFAARAAFCTKEAIESWSCGQDCDVVPVQKGFVRHIPRGKVYEAQAYVARLGPITVKDHCVISFRGSVDPMNWVADMKAWPMRWPKNASTWCPDCWVHAGFSEAYGELQDHIDTAIADFRCRTFDVVGHSLGAALAQIQAIVLRGERQALVRRVYLYGAPRVGNKHFVAAFEDLAMKQQVSPAAWRIIHYHDPVPRLAPEFYYKFMSREVYYNEQESSYKVCNAHNGEDPTCADSVPLVECINMDHVTYFNTTLQHKKMSEACMGSPEPHGEIIT